MRISGDLTNWMMGSVGVRQARRKLEVDMGEGGRCLVLFIRAQPISGGERQPTDDYLCHYSLCEDQGQLIIKYLLLTTDFPGSKFLWQNITNPLLKHLPGPGPRGEQQRQASRPASSRYKYRKSCPYFPSSFRAWIFSCSALRGQTPASTFS